MVLEKWGTSLLEQSRDESLLELPISWTTTSWFPEVVSVTLLTKRDRLPPTGTSSFSDPDNIASSNPSTNDNTL
jgi:hypothetical protein